MKVLVIESVRGKKIDISDLDYHGEVVYCTKLADRPEPSVLDVNGYRKWLLSSLPSEPFKFAMVGQTLKVALMISVLAEVYGDYDLLVFDSVYKRYVPERVEELHHEG